MCVISLFSDLLTERVSSQPEPLREQPSCSAKLPPAEGWKSAGKAEWHWQYLKVKLPENNQNNYW